MRAQGEAAAERRSFLIPPLSLKFTLEQEVATRCVIHARVYSGDHCFCHRAIETWYDACDEIPAMVASSMLSWTLWLVQFEGERRKLDRAEQQSIPFQFPQWPAPDPLSGRHDEVGF